MLWKVLMGKNIENLNSAHSVLWSKEGAQKKDARSQFERSEFVRRFTDQLRFNDHAVSPAFQSSSEVINSLQGGSNRVPRLTVNEDGVSLLMTPEEFQNECRKHQVSA